MCKHKVKSDQTRNHGSFIVLRALIIDKTKRLCYKGINVLEALSNTNEQALFTIFHMFLLK